MESEEDNFSPAVRQFLACSSVFLAPMVSGLTARREFHQRMVYVEAVGVNVVEIAPSVADFSGLLIGGSALYYIGRRSAVIMVNLFLLIPLLITASVLGGKLEFIGVTLSHVARQQLIVTYAVHVAEMTAPKFRSSFLCMYFVSYYFGVFLSEIFPIGSKSLITFSLLLNIGSVVLAFKTPESPHWLTVAGRTEEAEEIFSYLRGTGGGDDDEGTTEELEDMEAAIEAQLPLGLKNVLTRKFYVPLVIYLGLKLADENYCYLTTLSLQTLISVYRFSALANINAPVFLHFNLTDFGRHFGMIVGSVITVVTSFAIGRRHLFIISSIMGLSIFVFHKLAAYFLSMAVYSSLLCHFWAFLGTQQIQLMLPPEIFPAIVREIGVALCVGIDLSFQRVELYALSKGIYTTFYEMFLNVRWLFVPLGLFSSFFFLPETKDLTLIQAQEIGGNLLVQFVEDTYGDEEDE